MTSMVLHAGDLMPALSIQEVAERRNAIVEFTRAAMHEGVDYGIIPNTNKPTLLKPGAEKLCTLFGLTPTFTIQDAIKDWTGKEHGEPLFYFEYKCKLWKNGLMIAEGDGSCNSWEKKYRYRDAKRVCPDCGQPAIIKGRREFGGGWLCFKKQGGCGAKFYDGDQQIESQEAGQVSNPDMPDLVNTIKKMAQKRALLAAVLIAVNASEFFTQDMEDHVIEATYTVHTEPPGPPSRPVPTPAVAPAPDTSLLIAELRGIRKELSTLGGPLTELTIGQMKAMSVAELEQEIARTRHRLDTEKTKLESEARQHEMAGA